MVREDKIKAALQVIGGEAPGEQWIDAGGWDNEDVFVHGTMLVSGKKRVHWNMNATEPEGSIRENHFTACESGSK